MSEALLVATPPREVAAILRDADIPFAVVPENDDELRVARQRGELAVPVASVGERLRAAPVGAARGLLVMSSRAGAPLVAAARGRSPQLLVIAISADERAEEMLIDAGADCVVPACASALEVAKLLPELQPARDLGADELTALCASELTISCEQLANLDDWRTDALGGRANDLVLAVRRGSRSIDPRALDTALQEGDVVVVVGSNAVVRSVDELLQSRLTQ
jgi:hypothetical protein